MSRMDHFGEDFEHGIYFAAAASHYECGGAVRLCGYNSVTPRLRTCPLSVVFTQVTYVKSKTYIRCQNKCIDYSQIEAAHASAP
jgi:hypothetical protein